MTQQNNEDYTSLWNSKDSDDFLRYLKWEAFTYGYFAAMLFMITFIDYGKYYRGHYGSAKIATAIKLI